MEPKEARHLQKAGQDHFVKSVRFDKKYTSGVCSQ